jgi:hypothetical protein
MSSLEAFSAQQHDEGHFIISKGETASDAFFAHARQMLSALADEVTSTVVPTIEQRLGKWHPAGGFMVYHLGVNLSGESLRLHIWPEGERRDSAVGPHIHNHAWNLSSLIMAGTYSDVVYEVDQVGVVTEEEERKKRNLLRVFTLGYLPNGTDALVTEGSCVSVNPAEHRVVEAGNFHTISDGIFHLPIIPANRTVATLVLNSPSFGYNTTVLLDTPPNAFQEARKEVTLQEAERAARLLRSALGVGN